MTPSDLAAVHARVFSSTRAWTETEFAHLLQQQSTIMCGDTRCFVLLRVIADEAEILTLATDPAHRRRGLAREALTQAQDAACQAGATQMFLEVAEDNDAAKNLYSSTGYIQVGRRPGYYVPKDAAPIAALVLRKQLQTG